MYLCCCSNTTVFSHFLFTIVSFVEYLVAGMSYPDEAVRASVVYILVQLCVRKEDAVLALPLVHTMCRSLSVSLATSQSHELTINLMGEWIIALSKNSRRLLCDIHYVEFVLCFCCHMHFCSLLLCILRSGEGIIEEPSLCTMLAASRH